MSRTRQRYERGFRKLLNKPRPRAFLADLVSAADAADFAACASRWPVAIGKALTDREGVIETLIDGALVDTAVDTAKTLRLATAMREHPRWSFRRAFDATVGEIVMRHPRWGTIDAAVREEQRRYRICAKVMES